MTDHAYSIRQKFIAALGYPAETARLDAKRAALRQQLHAQGKYFIGEESLAKLNGGKVFDQFKGWK